MLENKINYQPNPCLLFHHLCRKRSATLLLDCTVVSNKQNLQSILIVDSALCITTNQQQVIFTAPTPNGNALLAHIYSALPNELEKKQVDDQLMVNYPNIDRYLDENSWLKTSSSFDVLRLIHHLANHQIIDSAKFLLAGLFSYYLVAYFENLLSVTKSNDCPDYCFYLAKHYLVIEYQKQLAKLISYQFPSQQRLLKPYSTGTKQLLLLVSATIITITNHRKNTSIKMIFFKSYYPVNLCCLVQHH
ncbi:MAG TPA: hypothetical protein ACHBX0_09485 [Arsenophonus sp.]